MNAGSGEGRYRLAGARMQNDRQNASRGKMPRSCIEDDGSRIAGNDAPMIDFSLLTAMDQASRHLLSRDHAGATRIVTICEQAGQLAESIAGTQVASAPAVCEPCGIWVSFGASQKE
jgi:hypothetical protein